jgi:hypothetical protein
MPAASPILSKSILEENIPSPEQALASHQATVESYRSEEMARLAYALWQQRGCPAGPAEADGLEAERQLSH